MHTHPFSHRIQAVLVSIGLGLALAAAALLALPTTGTLAAPAATDFNYPGGAPCDTTLQACINGAAAGDTIHILAGTYTQSFTLDKAVSLIGAGASTTRLVAPPNSRVFSVTAAMTNSTVISGLLVTGGNITGESGGGILIDSASFSATQPLLYGLVISNNRAASGGGIAWNDVMNVANSLFYSNAATADGGGMFGYSGEVVGTQFILNRADSGGAGLSLKGGVALTDTDFISNTSTGGAGGVGGHSIDIAGGRFQGNHSGGSGGAVAITGPGLFSGVTFAGNGADVDGGAIAVGSLSILTVRDSTLSGNSAVAAGGGIRNEGLLTVTNTTFSGNSAVAGGGLMNLLGEARLYFVTLSGNSAANGGGINQFGLTPGRTVTVTATIIADSPSGGNCYGGPGFAGNAPAGAGTISIVSGNHNLSTDSTCGGAFTQPQDQNNKPALLSPLAANGGPTQTHLPLPGSPAVDAAGTAGCPAADQRGVPRPDPLGGACDIGAVEAVLFRINVPVALYTAPVFITYRDFEIVPVSSTVKVGGTVTFLIEDSRHQPYSFTPPYNFDSPANLGPGSSISFNFDQPGTITLLCGYHHNMSATLVIEP